VAFIISEMMILFLDYIISTLHNNALE